MTSQTGSYDPKSTDSWLICATCGTQFPTEDRQKVTTCFICDDPRQYTPPTGQAFTTLGELRSQGHENTFTPISVDPDNLIAINTQPKVAIGQRAILVRTPEGNVLFDCITYLDDETVARIRELGGLKAIVISHPHFYTANLLWARTFDCPVYVAAEDKQWLAQRDEKYQIFLTETATEVFGTTVLKLGGHFPGSVVLLRQGRLLVADTLYMTPAGLGSWEADAVGTARSRPQGLNSFSFMWSIPNMIPLGPDDIERMWAILKDYEFSSAHGGFPGLDLTATSREMKQRVLESMQIQLRSSGHGSHPLLNETIA
ncbi:beta-lactamase-like protein [Poronia punctata]|nr:beta-lactamase-like protein [Poronia punctata]